MSAPAFAHCLGQGTSRQITPSAIGADACCGDGCPLYPYTVGKPLAGEKPPGSKQNRTEATDWRSDARDGVVAEAGDSHD